VQHTLSSFQIHHEKEHARRTHMGRARRFGLEAPLYRLRQKGHGGDRDRTDDPLLAKQVLSQLSYAPKFEINRARSLRPTPTPPEAEPRVSLLSSSGNSHLAKGEKRMGQGGLEPPTPRLSSVCSNQLSYWPPRSQTPRGVAPKAGTR
jgi:hypothetical protein